MINRFRGDPSLLQPAIEVVEARGGVPVLGVVPWIGQLGVADEDAAPLERATAGGEAPASDVEIAVIRLPRIANFDDVDPLLAEPGVRVRWVERARDLRTPDLILIPGTKATIADLTWLRVRGLDEAISARVEAGAHVLGICGGYQMLGDRLVDHDGVEAAPGAEVTGLGLLPVTTEFTALKETRRVGGTVCGLPGAWSAAGGLEVRGYEIHMGRTTGGAVPLLDLEGRPDGSASADGRIAGTYLHGLLHNDPVRHALLAGLGRSAHAPSLASGAAREQAFDRLAATVRGHLDIDGIRAMLREARC